jgi:hypothetical protein
MMQAASDQRLTVRDTAEGRQYVVLMPPLTTKSGAGAFELYQARAVIDAADFRIREFEASGSLLKQPYALAFTLIRQVTQPAGAVPAAAFEIQPGPDDIVFRGEATSDPLGDVIGTLLREIGRTRAGR